MRNLFVIVLCFLLFVPVWGAKRKVHTIGDSTMSSYKPMATPKRGWGMYLQAFFNTDSVEVNNRGKSGASTRTFYETENLWPSVKKEMQAGDYLIIQFAHNDEKCKGEDVYVENARLRASGQDTLTDMRGTEPNTTYKEYLRRYVNEARELGVKPILMSPVCRAYFQEDGTINNEGRHDLTKQEMDKDYVRCMREVAEEMEVPFLDMTLASQVLFEQAGKNLCMAHWFNCGDKTHTGAEGGMAVATLAYRLISQSQELDELKAWTRYPSEDALAIYAQAIEDMGTTMALVARGEFFESVIGVRKLENLEAAKSGYVPTGGLWPAGEIDEVANRYIEYTLAAEKKKGLVVTAITLPVSVQGGEGMNLHINYGFGEVFTNVTTIYENTALPEGKTVDITLKEPILVPAGEILHLRVLPWYDSNGRPQGDKYLQLGELKVKGKRLL